MSLKKAVYKRCVEEVEQRIVLLQKAIDESKEALNSETKSSAGDKHETGRAMAQLEMEKLGTQFQQAEQLKRLLLQINPDHTKDTVLSGSLVKSNSTYYFISVALGKVEALNTEVFVISPSAPLAQVFLNKRKGDSVNFNGRVFRIEDCL